MGSLVVIGTYATSLYFLYEEALELWKGNPFVLLFRVLITVVIGAPFALIGAGPYILGSFATADTKSPLIFLLVLSIIFVFDIWFRIEVIFFPTSSTSAIAIPFIPIYLSVPVLLLWGGLHLFKRRYRPRSKI